MSQRTIILEPADCGEKCDDVRNLFAKEIAEGSVHMTRVDSKEGKKLARALGLTKITEPTAVTVSDIASAVEVDEIMEDGAEEAPEEGEGAEDEAEPE